MMQSEELPWSLPQEPVLLMSEKLDTVRDALRAIAHARQKGWAAG
jgi:hypothetical protein